MFRIGAGVLRRRESSGKARIGDQRKFDDSADLDLSAWCAAEFSLKFLLETDAWLALLGEYAYGAARGAQDAAMIMLDTGIGASAIMNGRLLQSKHGLAGMIAGHLPVVLDGRLCTCGNCGCAESEASTAFLLEIYKEHAPGFKVENRSSSVLPIFFPGYRHTWMPTHGLRAGGYRCAPRSSVPIRRFSEQFH